MVMRNVPMYQAKIPIRGGGGLRHVDLRERGGANPIAAALQQIVERKRQKEQDELARQKTETDIAYRQKATDVLGQPKQKGGKIVVGEDGNTYLVDPITGQTKPVLTPDGKPLPAPKGKASLELLNAWLKLGQFEEPTQAEGAIRGALGQEILGGYGLEEAEEEVPGTEKTLGWPSLTEPAYRVRPERTEKRKVIRKSRLGDLEAPISDIKPLPPGERIKPTPITEALEKTEPERKELPAIAGELAQRPQRALRMKAKSKEPATIEEFKDEVARLKKIDMKAARAYYDRWAKKW